MGAIDIDPDLLHGSADAAVHAGVQAATHIEAEQRGNVPELITTLTREGPYAYAIKPEIKEDGTVGIPIESTLEGICAWYEIVRGESDLLPGGWTLLEINSEWYAFQEAITRGRPKGSDTVYETEVITLLPAGSGGGITGELVWFRLPRDSLSSAAEVARSSGDAIALRKQALEYHDRYLDAFRAGDASGILEVLSDRVQSAVRDYVNETGTLIGLRSREDHLSYYRSFFEKFELSGVDLLRRVVQDWYVFAEVRVRGAVRSGDGSGREQEFRLAEFQVPASDGRFVVRIGHGTDPV